MVPTINSSALLPFTTLRFLTDVSSPLTSLFFHSIQAVMYFFKLCLLVIDVTALVISSSQFLSVLIPMKVSSFIINPF